MIVNFGTDRSGANTAEPVQTARRSSLIKDFTVCSHLCLLGLACLLVLIKAKLTYIQILLFPTVTERQGLLAHLSELVFSKIMLYLYFWL